MAFLKSFIILLSSSVLAQEEVTLTTIMPLRHMAKMVRETGAQSLPPLSTEKVVFTAAEIDIGNIADTDNDQFIIAEEGHYLITARITFYTHFDNKANQYLYLFIYKNDAQTAEIYDAWRFERKQPRDGHRTFYITDLMHLVAGDTIDIRARQVMGKNITILSGAQGPSVSIIQQD